MTPEQFVQTVTFADVLWFFSMWYICGLIGWTILLFTNFADENASMEDCKFVLPKAIYVSDIYKIILRSLSGPIVPVIFLGFRAIDIFAAFCGAVKDGILWLSRNFFSVLHTIYERTKGIKLFDFERKS